MSIKNFFAGLWKEQCGSCGRIEENCIYGFCPVCLNQISFINNPEGAKTFHIARYEGPIKTALRHFKYRGKTYYGKRFSKLAADFIIKNGLPDFDIVVPVPLHWKKEFSRGFNQSAVISAYLGRRLGKKCPQHVLVKTKNTVSQTELHAKERKENVRKTFAVKKPHIIKNRKILLLDDICTSGATVKEAEKTLIACGASGVITLTIAKA